MTEVTLSLTNPLIKNTKAPIRVLAALTLASLALLHSGLFAAADLTTGKPSQRAPGMAVPAAKFVQKLAAGVAQRIVLYGTSLTAQGAWVSQLQSAIQSAYPGRATWVNSGGSGKASDWGVANLQTKVLEQHPDAVFIEFSMNDSATTLHITREQARANLATMVQRIRAAHPQCEIILQVMNPPDRRAGDRFSPRPDSALYQQDYRDFAALNGLLCIDHMPAFQALLDQGSDAFRAYVPDGVHPNAKGCASYMTPVLLRALGVPTRPGPTTVIDKTHPAPATVLNGTRTPNTTIGQPAAKRIVANLNSSAGSAAIATASETVHDLVVYGDSSGAVVAAISAKRQGLSVIFINPTSFPGGMSASGLGATDFLGKQATFGGIAAEFYQGVAAAYGKEFVRSFEPHVGRKVFEKMIADAGVSVVYNERLDRAPGKGVKMNGKRIESITTLSGKTYRGKIFIDTTYVGDLMAAAGVTYTVGREPESQYGEDLAGVRRGDTKPRAHYTQGDKDHFVKEVDPYLKAGDATSGLLPHVFKIENLKNGQGDKKIQAYNYRVCLTRDPALRIPIKKPEGYREIDHELLLRNFDAGDLRLPALIEPLAGPGSKVDWNNMHAVGSDYPGANWDYPDASYEKRREIEKDHETYIRGFLWTMSHNPRVPEAIRKKTAAYGLPKDEFTDNGGWPWMIYIREARRMVGDYVMNQHDCQGQRSAPDPVALGSFGMDSHAVQHFVTESGHANTDGVIWRVPPKPYGISYRSIIPSKGECENLFSPICLSTSHVAHGSIRMEPVFMALSQSAAIAAGVAIDKNVSVQAIAYPDLRQKLEAAKQILQPEPAREAGTSKEPARRKAP